MRKKDSSYSSVYQQGNRKEEPPRKCLTYERDSTTDDKRKADPLGRAVGRE